jgi:hypothetical protein
MKISQPSQDVMEVKTSAAAGITVGVIFMLVGIGAGVFALSAGTNGKSIVLLAGGIFFVIGLLVFLTASSETVVLRKGGQSTVEQKRAIGGSSKSQTFDTATIRSVRLVTAMDVTGNVNQPGGGRQRRSTLSLELVDNSQIVLGTATGNGGLSVNGINVGTLVQKAPLSKEAHQVSEFLGVALDAGDFSSPMAAIRSMKDAIMGQPQQPNATPPVVPGTVEPQQPAAVEPVAPTPPTDSELPQQ